MPNRGKFLTKISFKQGLFEFLRLFLLVTIPAHPFWFTKDSTLKRVRFKMEILQFNAKMVCSHYRIDSNESFLDNRFGYLDSLKNPGSAKLPFSKTSNYATIFEWVQCIELIIF